METRSSFNRNMNDTFVWLNDDCIFELFEWLSVDDLCSISRVSKRMKHLAENYFERKHFSKYLYIYCDPETLDVCVGPRTNYVARFRGFVKRIYVDGTNAKLDETGHNRLMSYVKSNCSSNMTEIHFRNVKFHEMHLDWMKGKLQKVETIEFKLCRCPSTYDIINNLLGSCGQLKHLILNEVSTWIRESMESKLCKKRFCVHYDSDTQNTNCWNAIFDKCEIIPQLEQLTLIIWPSPKINKYMECIADRATGLKKLWLKLEYFGYRFESECFEKLQLVLNSIPNMQFRFIIESFYINSFFGLADRNITDRVEFLCMSTVYYDTKICRLKNLKKLFISDRAFYVSNNTIEELYYGYERDETSSFLDHDHCVKEISSYLQNMSKLKKIVFYGRFDRCIPLRLVDCILLNLQKLNEFGRSVVIYLDHVSVRYIKTKFVEVKRLTEIDKYLLYKNDLVNQSPWLGDCGANWDN